MHRTDKMKLNVLVMEATVSLKKLLHDLCGPGEMFRENDSDEVKVIS